MYDMHIDAAVCAISRSDAGPVRSPIGKSVSVSGSGRVTSQADGMNVGAESAGQGASAPQRPGRSCALRGLDQRNDLASHGPGGGSHAPSAQP